MSDEKRTDDIEQLIRSAWHGVAGRPDESRTLLERGRILAEQRGDRGAILRCRAVEAILLYYRGEYQSAAEHARENLDESRQESEPFAEALSHYLLGIYDRLVATPSSAIARFDDALEALSAISDPYTEAKIRCERARNIGSSGRREEAISLLEEIEQISLELGSLEIRSHALYGQAVNRLELGDFNRAERELDHVIEIAEAQGYSVLLASALQAKNIILNGVGRTAEALEIELRVSREWLKSNYFRGAGLSLCNAGFMAMELGSYEQALDLLSRALTLADRKGLRAIEGIALGQIGQLYEALGEYDLIPEYQLRSMEIARQIEDHFTELVALYFLSRNYQRAGHLPRALAGFLHCLDLARLSGRRATESSLFEAIGELHIHTGEWQEAENALMQAITIAREGSLATELTAATKGLAALRMEQNRLDEAEELLRESIAMATEAGLFVLHREGLRDLESLGEQTGNERLIREAEIESGRLVSSVFDAAAAQRTRLLLQRHEDAHLLYHVQRLDLDPEATAKVEKMAREWNRVRGRPSDAKRGKEIEVSSGRYDSGIQVQTFGRFAVTQDRDAVPLSAFKRKRARDLFKLLAVHHRSVVTVDQIEESLWGEPAPGINSLVMNAASHIRSALNLGKDPDEIGARLLRTPDGYLLDLGEQGRVDLFRFKEMIVAARHATRASEKLDLYDRALGIADGPFLPDDRDLPWTESHRLMLEDAWYEGGEFIAREYLRAGMTGEAIDRARTILMRDRTSQGAWEILLSALLAAGRQGTAREEFQRCRGEYRAILDEEPPESIREIVLNVT